MTDKPGNMKQTGERQTGKGIQFLKGRHVVRLKGGCLVLFWCLLLVFRLGWTPSMRLTEAVLLLLLLLSSSASADLIDGPAHNKPTGIATQSS